MRERENLVEDHAVDALREAEAYFLSQKRSVGPAPSVKDKTCSTCDKKRIVLSFRGLFIEPIVKYKL